ncbi:MAG: 7-cyano-7-deazaguanine synthase [Candidatus Sericytochromatia bacterium]
MIKRCVNCLIKEDTRLLYDFFAVSKDEVSNNSQKVTLNKDGICQYCIKYKKHYNKEILDTELKLFTEDNKNNKYHSIVALSGGKDSISALYIAKKVLNLNVIAMTYDNGFIPKSVIEQSERICKQLDIPYIVYKQEMYNEFKNEYIDDTDKKSWISKTGIDFCSLCSKNIWKYIQELNKSEGIYKVILGNKIYTSLEPYVSCIKKIPTLINNEKRKITCINLLFALGINTKKQQDILNLVNWKKIEFKGYTTNCLIPGFTEYPRTQKIQTDSDAGYIEMELRSNIYSVEEAKELILDKEYHDNSNDISSFFNSMNL